MVRREILRRGAIPHETPAGFDSRSSHRSPPTQYPNEPMKTERTFTAIITPLMPALERSAARYTRGNSVLADDLLQETLLRAWRFRETYKPECPPRPWLMAIMRNTFCSLVRASVRASETEYALASSGLGIDAGECADDIIDRRLLSTVVVDALDSIPVNFRDAAWLAAMGYSYAEIADIMECPIGTVMSRVYRGRTAIREHVGQDPAVIEMAA